MAYTPVSGIATQYSTDSNELASGYWLKFYVSNTSTPLSMATDYTGDVLLVKCKLNTAGFPITDVGDNTSVFIPYVNQSYRLVIFRTEADADANNTAAALVNVSHVAAIVFDSLLDAAVSSAAASAVTASTKADESAASAASIVGDVATATAKANEAAASASAALSSESAAATSETNAGSSETAAAASAAAASSSETASATSETNAAASAASVLQAEIDSAASAAAALSSENNSATSETNAAASASAASSSESAASTSETNATSAASAASTSETNALASKNAAAISATDAQASADSIVGDVAAASGFADASQASYDAFVDIYHGALSSAPTTNLNAGDLYFDIPTSAMRVYDGALWRAVTTVVEGVYAVAEYTNIATQTTITTAYDVGLVQVLYNGVQLNLGDFTATNGTTIVLATAVASATDVITVIRWGAVTTSTFLGTAATLDTGTAAGELPTNADLATGAFTTVGTAATANVQTSTTDTTANALMAVGSFGLGGLGLVVTDANTALRPGFYCGPGVTGLNYFNEGSGQYGALLVEVRSVFQIMQTNTFNNRTATRYSGDQGATWTGWYEVITADSAGNVGIGTSFPTAPLHTVSSENLVAKFSSSDVTSGIRIEDTTTSYDFYVDSGNLRINNTAGSERLRLDSSGHFLVGKTAPDAAVVGSELRSDGMAVFSRSSTSPTMYVSTLGSDGDLITFRKDSTTVGSIGVGPSVLYAGKGSAALAFAPFSETNSAIFPYSSTTNAGRDAGIDLGTSWARFKDLYLSGGVYLGGTGANNKLDDYEEGTWTPSFSNTTGTVTGSYIKIGSNVFYAAYLSVTSVTSAVTLTGLPFSADYQHLPNVLFLDSGSNYYSGLTSSSGSAIFATSANGGALSLASNIPFTWSNSGADTIQVTGTYRTNS